MTGFHRRTSRSGVAARAGLAFAIACVLTFAVSTVALARVEAIVRISSGGDLGSYRPSVSADGRYVAFESDAHGLVATDAPDVTQVYVFDRTSKTMERVSVADDGTPANSYSYGAALSADGRWVAFCSESTNLTTDTIGITANYYLYDRQTDTIECLTANATDCLDMGERPTISADGRYVAYSTAARNIVTGDTNYASDVFLYDRLTDETERISVNNAHVEGDGNSYRPSISGDGAFVAFESYAPNLVADDTNDAYDIFLFDHTGHSISRVSVDADGDQATGSSQHAFISADGAFVAYDSDAADLVPGDTNGVTDVFRYRVSDGSVTNITIDGNGPSADGQNPPTMNADGSFVAFSSVASNLVPDDTNETTDVSGADIFVYDVAEDAFTRESVTTTGSQSDGPSYAPVLDAAGSYVAFHSDAANLTADDTNGASDVFMRDRYLDVVPPTTIADPSPASPDGSAGWYVTTPTITLIPNEPSTVYYQWDAQLEGGWSTYSTALTPPLGSHTLYYFGIDTTENTETVKSLSLKVDTELPLASTDATGFYYFTATINLAATDTVSGLDGVYWRIDGAADFTESTQAVCTVSGAHTIEYYAKDLAGNYGDAVIVPFEVANRYEQTDPNITWGSSKWRTYWGSQYSGNSFARARGLNAGFIVKFDGSAIDWIGEKSPMNGIARLSLDGGTTQTVDLYSASTLEKQVLWSRHGLTNGSHTLRVDWTGTRNPSAYSDYINADAFDIAGQTAPGSEWIGIALHYEEDNPYISYGTTYTSIAATAASGGSLRTMREEGNGYSATFYGVALELTGRRGPDQGIAQILIDGTPWDTVDFYSPTVDDAQMMWNNQDFYEATHTVRVEWTGSKNASSSGDAINLDALDIVGVLDQAPEHTTRYQETDTRVYYNGAWSDGSHVSHSGGAWKYLNSAGGAYVTFVGKRFDLYASKGPAYGKARVKLDGVETTSVDFYSASTQYQQKLLSLSGLSDGSHVLAIEWLNQKSASSSGYTVGLDAFDLVGRPVTDTVAPFSADNATSAWRATPATVTLTATDTNSYVAGTRYRVNGGALTTYTVPFGVSAEGTDTIEYRSVDGAGNWESTKTATVRIDYTAPTVGNDAPGGWVNSTAIVHLNATDTLSGVSSILYSTDGTTPTVSYTTSIPVSADGTTTIRYTAIDSVGNASSVASVTVRVDKVLPFSSCDAPSAWSSSTVNVAISATDTLSGVASRKYVLDGGALSTYASPIPISTEGTHTLLFYAIDTAGNREATNSATVRVDKTAPSVADDAPAGWVNGPVHVHLSATDTVSGVASVLYSLDGSEPTLSYGTSITVSAEGTTTLRYKAVDVAGLSTSGQTTVRVDNGTPTVFDDAPSTWVTQTVLASLSASDAVSGVASIVYSLDGSNPTLAYPGPLTISGEGTTTLRYRATDQAANSTSVTRYVRIDRVAPATTSNAVASYHITATVTLSAADPCSGVALTEYKLDSGPWTSGTVMTTTAYGWHTVYFRSVDNVGNVEATGSATFSIRSRWEQNDPRIYYNGSSWTTGTHANHSSGSWKYTNVAGASAYLTFTGTRLDLIGFKGSSYGQALVTIDGTSPVTVDFYSATSQYQQTVRSFTGLTETTHTVSVTCLGSHSASSTGNYIGIDAFETIGTPLVDTLAPVTTDDASFAWSASTATITLSPTDANSFVAATHYAVNGGALTTYTAPFTIAGEGTSTVEYRSVDAAGNTETTKAASVRIDKSGPSAGDDVPLVWVNHVVDAHLSATDTLSGLDRILYSTDGSAPTLLYGASVPVTVDGTTTLKYKSIDSVGNASSIRSADVRIDRVAPDSVISAPSGWATATVSVSVATSDVLSGVAARSYSLNGADASPYTAPVDVSAEGTHTFGFRATDAAGNVESTKSATVRVDTSAPTSSDDAPSGWVGGPVSVHLSATDTVSGVASVLYSLDGSEPTLAYETSITISAEGTTTLRYKVTDVAGLSTSKQTTVRIDDTAPGVTDDAPSGWVGGPVDVTIEASDAVSGLASLLYSIDGSDPSVPYEGAVRISAEGTTTLKYRATDIKGNVADVTRTVRIDDTAPVIGDDAPAGWVGGPVSVHLSATDTVSGVASVLYSLDGSEPTLAYGTSVTISAEGTTTLRYAVTDLKGNSSSATKTVRIDDTAPVIGDDAPSGWVGGPVSVHLSATDTVSGVASVLYSLDGSEPTLSYGTSITISAEGTTTLRYAVTDLKGNSSSATKTVRIDYTAPTTTSNAAASYLNVATVTLFASDGGSGVARTEWDLDASGWTSGTVVSTTAPGTHTLRFRSLDGVGNTEDTKTVSFDVLGRVEQTDARIYYKGPAWGTGTSGLHSGGSWKYANTAGHSLFLTFTGTRIDLIAAKGPAYGQARLSIDGTASITLDFYNPTSAYKQTLRSVTGLAAGAHTLSLEWLASRNASSTGYYVGLDAVDIVGLPLVDTLAPVTTDDASFAWSASTATITLSPTDANSFVAATHYAVNGGALTTYTAPFTIAGEGTSTVEYRSVDAAGNTETTKAASVRIDKSGPSAGDDVPLVWVNHVVDAHLSATDTLSGLDRILYSTDGSAPTLLYGASVPVTVDGTTTLKYKSIDSVGNASSIRSADVRIDRVAPDSVISAPSGWATATVSVSVATSDVLSGVAARSYSLNGADASPYTAPVDVSAEGTHTFGFRATDAAGNVESTKSATVRVDTSAPTSSDDAPSGWVGGPVSVHLSATDTVSGVASVLYSLDGSEPTLAYETSITISAEGTTTLRYKVTDVAGLSTSKQTTVRIDDTAPGVTDDAPSGWVGGPVSVHLSATDTVSGVASVLYSLDGSEPTLAYETSITISAEGTTTLRYKVTDVAGLSTSKQTTVRIDDTAPGVTDDAPSGWVGGPVDVTIEASDAVSGLASLLYSIDGSDPSVPYEGAVRISAEGTTTLKYRATDIKGNVADVTRTVRIDDTAPVIGDDAPAGWVGGPVSVHLSATDTVSGVASVLYSLDGSEPTLAYGTSVTISAEGTTTLRYAVTDLKGNSSSATKTVRIDDTAPVIGDDAPSGWVGGPVSVHLSATDTVSGVASVLYSLDGSEPTLSYGTSITISAEGTTTLRYAVTDLKGNSSSATKTVRIDYTAPTTTSNAAASYLNVATVTLFASDGGSGVARTEWDLDASGWTSGTVVSTTAPGTHTLRFRSLDGVGNTEDTKTVSFDVLGRVEQTDARIYYKGPAWGTGTSGLHSGGSWKYANTAGHSLFLTFTGTRIDLIAAKGPAYGQARLSIDGTASITLDFYNPTSAYKQTLRSVTGLAAGAHTLSLEWLASRNASSTGYYVGLDAVDIVGLPLVDTLAPVTTDDASFAWSASTATITLSPTDANSFVAATHYAVNGGALTTYTAPFTIAGEGTSTVEYRSVDAAGNTETTKAASVRIDKSGPSAGDDVPLVWVNHVVDAHLSATDTLSGLDRILYSTDGSAPTLLYGASVPVTVDGTTTLKYKSIDSVGNASSIRSADVRIDRVAPDSVISAPSGWATATVSVSVATSDVLSGVAARSYSLNGADASPYTAPVDVSAEGTHTFGFRATDAAGNVESTKSATVRVDTSAPTSSDDAPSGWVGGPVSVHLSATDTVSGVASVLYSLDGSEPTLAYETSITISAEGTTTLRYKVTDVAGLSTSKQTTVRIDDTAPGVTDDAPSGWVGGPVSVHLSATDTVSGVASVLYSLDGSEPTLAYETSITISAEGTTTLRYKVTDVAGLSTSKQTTVRIDDTAPGVTDDAPSGWVGGPVDVTIEASDAVSGLASLLYSIDGSDPSVPYEGAVRISAEGTTTLKYRATDIKGNVADVTRTVRIDDTAPVIGDDAPAGWVGGPVSVHLSATDTVSGVASVLYSLDGSEPTLAYGTSVTVSAEGTTTLRYAVTDLKGNSSSATKTVRIDDTAPQASDDAPAGWVTDTVDVTISYSDAISGVESALYSLDGSDPSIPVTSPITISDEGTTTLRYLVTDLKGNSADVTRTVRIDRAAPALSDDAPAGWTRTAPTIHIAATDAVSGVDSVLYSLDGGLPTLQYAGGVLIDAEGTTLLRYRAADLAGNASTGAATVRLDSIAPLTSSTATTTYFGSATVTLTASDGTSGLDRTEYDLDGSGWTSGTVVTTSEQAYHTLLFRSVDVAGNAEATHSVSFSVIGRVEQDDARLYYKGSGWTTATSAQHSAGSWRYANTSGHNVYLTFTGTRVDLIGLKGPSYGHARLTIDGTSPVTVDYYNPTVVYRQTLRSVSGLAPGTHTLALEWLASKNTSSTGYYIGLDAVDIDGAPQVDTLAPVTSDDAVAGWHPGTQTVTLSATDANSFVAATRYALNGAAATTYTAPIVIAAEGTSTIEYRSVDAAGNTEATKTASVRIDKSAPSAGDDAPGGWVNSTANVHLTATDTASGVSSILYSTDGTTPTVSYTTSIPVSADGTTTIRYKAIDAVGNTSTVRLVAVRVDTLAPTSACDVPGGWSTSPVSLTVNASDALSGIAARLYTLDSGPETTYTAPVTISTDGTHTFAYRALDVAGNYETLHETTIRVDRTAPEVSTDVTSTYAASASISIAASDGISGVATVEHNLDGAGWSAGVSVVTTMPGRHVLDYRAADVAGNVSSPSSVSFDVLERHEETSPYFSFGGSWSTTTGAGYSGGSMKIGSGTGSGYIVSFRGPRVELIGSTGPAYGIAKIVLDNATSQTVSLYSTGTVHGTRFWTRGDLADTTHTVRVEWTGTKDSSATSDAVVFDAADIAGVVCTAPAYSTPPTRFQQTDSKLAFGGAWSTASSGIYSGGSLVLARGAGTGYNVAFSGTSVDLICLKGPNYGKMRVSVDGAATETVSLYSPTYAYQQTAYHKALPGGSHTLRVEWTGEKDAGATNDYINLDAVDIGGTLAQASAFTGSIARFEQTEPKISYGGSGWTTASGSYSGGNLRLGRGTGTGFQVDFSGTGIDWIALKGKGYGIARVSVDGTATELVDLYADPYQTQQAVVSRRGLAEGAHTLRVEWTGSRNASATGDYINLDATDIVGTLVQAPEYLTRHEQNDPMIAYNGSGWSTATAPSYSAGSLRLGRGGGTEYTVKFFGTGIDWIALTGKGYGIAQVVLDGTTETVDLYSASYVSQTKVWSKRGLAEANHTVRFVWTGSKNASATGDYLDIDAVDIKGALMQAPAYDAMTRYEQNDPKLLYSGSAWSTSTSGDYSSGSLKVGRGTDTSVTVKFSGTGVEWIALKGNGYGLAAVYLDGSQVATASLWSATYQSDQVVYSNRGLANTTHTLRIVWLGLKGDPSASSDYISLDAIDVKGTLLQAP